MNHESQKGKTARQEWTETINETQRDINESLESLKFEVDAANLRLAQIHRADEKQAQTAAIETLVHFNQSWQYHRDIFMVSGQWYSPQPRVSEGGIAVSLNKQDVLEATSSSGFTYTSRSEFGSDGEPRIGLSFITKQGTVNTPTILGEVQLQAFAEMSEVSLQFLNFKDKKLSSSRAEEVELAILTADLFLSHLASTELTDFYSQPADMQKRLLYSVAEIIEDTLPAPDSFDKAQLKNTKTKSLYRRPAGGGKMVDTYAPDADQAFEVSGEVVGATVIDLLDDEPLTQGYTSPDKLKASRSGICLIVERDVDLTDADDTYDRIFLLPVRDTVDLAIEIV